MKKLLALILALSMALSLTACGGGKEESSGDKTPTEKMFNIVLPTTFVGFNPLKTNDVPSGIVQSQLYETLYKIDKDGSYINVLAEEAPVFGDDGMSATIKLREGVKFQDGTDFNAEAVKYTLEKVGDPEYGGVRASLVASIDTIEVIDDYTVKLNLKFPDAVLQAKLSHSSGSIISPTADQAQDLMVTPCGTGAYKLVSTVSGSNVVMTRNDEYWGEAPEIKDVTFTVISEESTAIGRLQTGEADFMTSVSPEAMSRIESLPNVKSEGAETSVVTVFYLRPNSSTNPLMANKDFRTAIIKSIDRDGYLEYVLDGRGAKAESLICPGVFGYSEAALEANIDYDPEGAKKLIADNGWADEEIVFLISTSATNTPMAEFVQANLKEAGFNNVRIDTMDWASFVPESKTDDRYDMTSVGWANSIRDASEFFGTNFHTELSARARINDAEVDQWLEDAKQTSDQAVRAEILEKINIKLASEAFAFPMYYGKTYYAYNSVDYTGAEIWVNSMFYVQNIKLA